MNITTPGYANFWDNGYPAGGNYWSDYEERYPDANELDDSGIWDTPYVIDENNQDNNPLMNPWYNADVNFDGIVDIFDLVIVAGAYGSSPGDDNWNPNADVNRDDTVDIFDLVIVASHYGEHT